MVVNGYVIIPSLPCERWRSRARACERTVRRRVRTVLLSCQRPSVPPLPLSRVSRSGKCIRVRVAVRRTFKRASKCPARPEATLNRSTSSHTSTPPLLGYPSPTRLHDLVPENVIIDRQRTAPRDTVRSEVRLAVLSGSVAFLDQPPPEQTLYPHHVQQKHCVPLNPV